MDNNLYIDKKQFKLKTRLFIENFKQLKERHLKQQR